MMDGKIEPQRKIRIWVDGCYDLVHFGHANALRQAKLMGDYLVVGVHSDEDIAYHKGPPVFTLEERIKLVSSIKWVDEVVPRSSYLPSPELLDQHNCDFCAHGDDPSIMADGTDAYRLLKESGRYKEFKRTQGISTTNLVGRMLLATKCHHSDREVYSQLDQSLIVDYENNTSAKSPFTGDVQFLPSSQRLLQFADSKDPKPGEIVIYVDGDFDLFHAGHVSFLEKCLEYGTYIIVGIHTDQEVNKRKGANYPIMNLFERTLTVLSCKYVSNVIIGAPYSITEELLTSFGVNFVVQDVSLLQESTEEEFVDKENQIGSTIPRANDPYAVPKRLGMYKEVDSNCKLSTDDIIRRIIDNRLAYIKRNHDKEMKELVAHSK